MSTLEPKTKSYQNGAMEKEKETKQVWIEKDKGKNESTLMSKLPYK